MSGAANSVILSIWKPVAPVPISNGAPAVAVSRLSCRFPCLSTDFNTASINHVIPTPIPGARLQGAIQDFPVVRTASKCHGSVGVALVPSYLRRPPPRSDPRTPRTISRPTDDPIVRATLLAAACTRPSVLPPRGPVRPKSSSPTAPSSNPPPD